MSPNGHKTIGILGGMGPSASASLYDKMLEYAQREFGAVQDDEYPPIVIYSLPLVGFDESGIVDPDSVRSLLIEGVKKLEDAGCDLIIVACNTVHIFYDDMQSAVKIPIFNIVKETAKRVINFHYQHVGLICSQSTTNAQLYENEFARHGIRVSTPSADQQKDLNRVIKHVMGGHQGLDDVLALKKIIRDYLHEGAEAIVIGCTEIPLAINQSHTDTHLFDSTRIIVECAVDFSMRKC